MLSLFLTESAAGSLIVLLLVPLRSAGRGFLQFSVGLSSLLMLLGAALTLGGGGGTGAGPQRTLFGLSAILLALSAGLFRLGRFGAGRALMLLGLIPALAGVGLDALSLIPAGDGTHVARLLYPLDAVSAGLVPGSALIAMILGHYYLNVPGLSIGHLQRLTLVFLGTVIVRGAVVLFSVARSREALSPLMGLLLDTGSLMQPGGLDPFVLVLLLLHVLFGVVASGAMAFMAWRTALISSTQSATGILYVALLMTIMGELASRYLITMTGLPL
ncbi:MAG TPA: hypothetical protein VGK94_11945 [Candidatus Polarisedimenticolia bacterium]|jgi:hypothetical protein